MLRALIDLIRVRRAIRRRLDAMRREMDERQIERRLHMYVT